MTRKHRRPGPSVPTPVRSAEGPRSESRGRSSAGTPRRAARRRWTFRLLTFGGPWLALGLIEGILRLAGYGSPTSFFIDADAAGLRTTNPRFVRQFYPGNATLRPDVLRFSARRPPGTFRIFVLGESAALGTPDPAFGFSRILEVALRQEYPDRQFEVLNAAMRGINSHIIRHIARDCARHEPDLFILYLGNNEPVGFQSPDPGDPLWTQNLSLLRSVQWLKSTRLGQWTGRLRARIAGPKPAQDMPFFRAHRLAAADPLREAVGRSFARNVRDICRAASEARARVILCTVPVNLRDCPPLGSLHRAGLDPKDAAAWDAALTEGRRWQEAGKREEAIAPLRAAERLDPDHAELQFRLGECLVNTGEADAARTCFTRARDLDALPFRADTRLNEALRRTAAEPGNHEVILVDVERAFQDSPLSDQGIPGDRLFHDHVHPTFEGNHLLAATVFPAVVAALEPRLGPLAHRAFPTRDECALALAYTEVDEVNVLEAMLRLKSGPPFLDQAGHASRLAQERSVAQQKRDGLHPEVLQGCLRTYLAAVRQQPNDWKLHFNLGALHEQFGQYPAALEQYRWLTREFPAVAQFRVALAGALLQTGQPGLALAEAGTAARLDPDHPQVRELAARLRVR